MSLSVRLALIVTMFLSAGLAFGQDKAPPPPPPVAPTQPAPKPPVAPAQPEPKLPDPKAVAATVNDTPIMERSVFRAVRKVPPERWKEAREQLVNFLIDNVLIDQYLQQLKVVVEPKEVDAAVMELKAELAKEKLEFEKVMIDLVLTEPELREQLGAELRWRKFLDKYAPPETLRKFFDGNKNFFDGSQIRARHILVPAKRDDAKEIEASKQKALILRKQIEDKAGQELAKLPPAKDELEKEKARGKSLENAFAEVAAKESTCPTKADGGEVGWFARTGRMVEPFARAAFGLKPYQLSDAVVTEFGCHLILPTDTKPGRDVKFEEMKDVVKEVYADRMREAIITQMRPPARIVINAVLPGKQ